MSLECEFKLTGDILIDCDNKPKGGIEANAVILNFPDVDKGTSTLDALNKLIVTNLSTLSGTTGFSLEGLRQINGVTSTLVPSEVGFDKHAHTFVGFILNPSAANKKFLREMYSGGRYIVVVEKKWKGIDQDDAFEVLGWDVGMVMTELVYNSNENDGAISFTFASAAGFEEPEMTRNNLQTDYATTKTAFTNKYATA